MLQTLPPPVTAKAIGDGFTVIVKEVLAPVQVMPQLVKVGVTVMVATTGALVLLRATKAAMFPPPAPAKPMAGMLLVQLNTTPAGVPVKLTAVVKLFAHKVWFETAFTVGVWLSSTVAEVVAKHPIASVTVTV